VAEVESRERSETILMQRYHRRHRQHHNRHGGRGVGSLSAVLPQDPCILRQQEGGSVDALQGNPLSPAHDAQSDTDDDMFKPSPALISRGRRFSDRCNPYKVQASRAQVNSTRA